MPERPVNRRDGLAPVSSGSPILPGILFAMSILLAVASFAVSGVAMAQDSLSVPGLMNAGDQFYHDREYDSAIDAYLKVVNLGYEGTSLYYNLGNAYYRTGKIGYAILYYEKALKLSPGDDDSAHNLAIAETKTVDKIDALPRFFLFQWWESFLALFSLAAWTRLVYALYLLLLVSIGIYFFARRPALQRLSFLAGLLAAFVLIVAASAWGVRLNRSFTVKNAIVLEPSVTVKLAPDAASNDAFIVHEGLKVREFDRVDSWVRIRLQDGKQGWIQQDEIGTI